MRDIKRDDEKAVKVICKKETFILHERDNVSHLFLVWSVAVVVVVAERGFAITLYSSKWYLKKLSSHLSPPLTNHMINVDIQQWHRVRVTSSLFPHHHYHPGDESYIHKPSSNNDSGLRCGCVLSHRYVFSFSFYFFYYINNCLQAFTKRKQDPQQHLGRQTFTTTPPER
jgi:hypothetical protein